MPARLLLGLAAILGLTAFAPAPLGKPDKKVNPSSQDLQGTWSVISAERGGGRAVRSRASTRKVRIDKDKWSFLTTTRGGTERAISYFLVLDSRKEPKQFDLKRQADGRVTLHGIYRLEGDTLKVAYANTIRDTARPTSFSDLEVGQFLLTLKRDKP
jgi:uncharacterized protein (TIGR03067 family)